MTRGLNSRTLVLLGAGGFGRETLHAARASLQAATARWDHIAFADDRPELHGSDINGAPVYGPIEAVLSVSDAQLVITAARARAVPSRRDIAQRASVSERRWATVIHPDASLYQNTAVGYGSVVLAGTVATANVVVGNHVAIMPRCVLTHDVVIGDYATLASGVCLGGGVAVEPEAYLGAGALVREGCRIGEGALIGMGAVILHDVPAGEVWVGNPGRRLRRRRTLDDAALKVVG